MSFDSRNWQEGIVTWYGLKQGNACRRSKDEMSVQKCVYKTSATEEALPVQ